MEMSKSVAESEIPGGARVTGTGRAWLAIGPNVALTQRELQSWWGVLQSNAMV